MCIRDRTNSRDAKSALAADDPLVLRPDFWVTYLWKRLIGRSVLNASSADSRVRVYAFQGVPPSPFAESECTSASVQLVLINLDEHQQITVDLGDKVVAVSYTHLRAHETPEHLVCRLLLEKKKKKNSCQAHVYSSIIKKLDLVMKM
eukprot:TRINITY_DN36375_c0_g1_i2.p1 TRINITY_DN36375_c0_g1~~TRINITY_DN36375_c0_g1_i2.p1  ORF type:complete len:147 (-),score=40.72 TRINITY_DN36375_c0_g1_i2:67-507(-)